MKRNVGKAINIINACSFHPYTGKKALRVKRSNRLYWSHRVAVGSGLALSSIPSVPPHKKVQIYIRSPFIYIFKRNIKFARVQGEVIWAFCFTLWPVTAEVNGFLGLYVNFYGWFLTFFDWWLMIYLHVVRFCFFRDNLNMKENTGIFNYFRK